MYHLIKTWGRNCIRIDSQNGLILLFLWEESLPTTCKLLDALSSPATLIAVHVYWALSPPTEPSISNALSSWMVYLPSLVISRPSFVHVTVGVGTPLVEHWMVILVLVSAVTLSPMVKIMGLRSWASNFCGRSGMSILGLASSSKKRWLTMKQFMKWTCHKSTICFK